MPGLNNTFFFFLKIFSKLTVEPKYWKMLLQLHGWMHILWVMKVHALLSQNKSFFIWTR